jgi:hypothetical protein
MRRRADHIVPAKPYLDSLDGGEFLAVDGADLFNTRQRHRS